MSSKLLILNFQIQTIVGDLKSQELFALLQRDRANAKTSTKNQIAYRMQAEGVLGGNENLYKIEWVGLLDFHKPQKKNWMLMMNVKLPGKETLTIQLLSEEDRSVDDAETTQERWAQYIESFALVCSLFVKAPPLTVGRLPSIRIFRHTQQKVSSSASTRPSSDETLPRSKLAKKHYPPLPVHLLQ